MKYHLWTSSIQIISIYYLYNGIRILSNANRWKSKINDHSEPIEEAIYDSGGANVKS